MEKTCLTMLVVLILTSLLEFYCFILKVAGGIITITGGHLKLFKIGLD